MPDEHQENTPATAASEAGETDADGADEPAVPSPRLLEILVCPKSKGELRLVRLPDEIVAPGKSPVAAHDPEGEGIGLGDGDENGEEKRAEEGAYVVRMDQPYRTLAQVLLGVQSFTLPDIGRVDQPLI